MYKRTFLESSWLAFWIILFTFLSLIITIMFNAEMDLYTPIKLSELFIYPFPVTLKMMWLNDPLTHITRQILTDISETCYWHM